MTDLLNQKICVRSSGSGCWYGTLLAWCPVTRVVTLGGARHMHRWWAARGASFAAVAQTGIHPEKEELCRIDEAVDQAIVCDVLELLTTTPEARASIERQVASQA